MVDWHGKVSRKLEHSKFSAAEREDISRELGHYLEYLCGDASSRGVDDPAATESATAELHEDKHLGASLYRARRENAMHLNDRTRQFWFPGITVLLAGGALLAASQAAALWTYHAYAPMPHAQRYPDLVHNLARHDGAALMIYLGWLYTLPFLGALGAGWSRRCGGNRLAQITTGFFPLLLFLAIFIGQWIGVERNTFLPFLGMGSLPPAHFFFPFLSVSGNLFVSWLVIPGAALLLGVLPLVWKSGISGHDRAASATVAQLDPVCAR